MKNYNILVTNDDGIDSPGLKAAAEAVAGLGRVTVVAPTNQQTAAGRGLFGDMQSHLMPVSYQLKDTTVEAYHCDCSPALIVRHYLRTLGRENKPDLLVSGINYGENLGANITSSGTVGAALEGGSCHIPAIAISKQTDIASHRQYTEQDWTVTMHFLNQFARLLLKKQLPPDVDLLKIDVPQEATTSTEWKMTRLARATYYTKTIATPTPQSTLAEGHTEIRVNRETLDPDSDIFVFAVDKKVSVTPVSIDMSSRIRLTELEELLKA